MSHPSPSREHPYCSIKPDFNSNGAVDRPVRPLQATGRRFVDPMSDCTVSQSFGRSIHLQDPQDPWEPPVADHPLVGALINPFLRYSVTDYLSKPSTSPPSPFPHQTSFISLVCSSNQRGKVVGFQQCVGPILEVFRASKSKPALRRNVPRDVPVSLILSAR